MFSAIRWLAFLLFCLVVIGLWRGWFSFSTPNPGPEADKINISVTVDKQKVRSDVTAVEQKVGQRFRQYENKPGSPDVK